MSAPLVSVGMVVCNVERFLAESIESILAQSFKDFEFIIVDFGSTDASASISANYARKDNRIKVHTIPHCSLAEARNAGCFLAQGRYLAIMDADDISAVDRLALEYEFMEGHPAVGLVGGGTEWIDATGRLLCRNHFPATNKELQAALLTESPFCQPSVLIRREAFACVGGYRAAFAPAEDYDLWLRIAERFEVANLPQIVLKYRIHPGQVSVARCQSQALCAAGARAAAISRRSGNPDPLASVKDITHETLHSLGLTENAQQTALARGYLAATRSMCRVRHYSQAAKLLADLPIKDFDRADVWVRADLFLCAARVHWRQRHVGKSLVNVCRAVSRRPLILGRPLKRLLHLYRKQQKGSRVVTADAKSNWAASSPASTSIIQQ